MVANAKKKKSLLRSRKYAIMRVKFAALKNNLRESHILSKNQKNNKNFCKKCKKINEKNQKSQKSTRKFAKNVEYLEKNIRKIQKVQEKDVKNGNFDQICAGKIKSIQDKPKKVAQSKSKIADLSKKSASNCKNPQNGEKKQLKFATKLEKTGIFGAKTRKLNRNSENLPECQDGSLQKAIFSEKKLRNKRKKPKKLAKSFKKSEVFAKKRENGVEKFEKIADGSKSTIKGAPEKAKLDYEFEKNAKKFFGSCKNREKVAGYLTSEGCAKPGSLLFDVEEDDVRKKKTNRSISNFFRSLQMAERLFLGIILACVILVGSGVAIGISFDPQKDAENAIEELSSDFYTNVLYPRVSRSSEVEPETVAGWYALTGLPPVKLRQMLYYDDFITEEYADRVNNQYITCDTNKTVVKFYPIEPFGAEDFEIKITSECEKV